MGDGMNDKLHHTNEEQRTQPPDEEIGGLDHHTSDNSQYPGLMAQMLELNFLKNITKGFSPSQEIGSGGYAVVYKGEKEDGGVIAIKKITIKGNVDDKQFRNELEHLSTLTHQNIVKLEGYCYDVEKALMPHQGREVMADGVYMLLCFEYMSNGSLEKHIKGKDASSGLNWPQRYKIIEGICNGLHYLHEGRDGSPIIHRDLKLANILLDDNMVPKIADFGISRLMSEDKTHTCTNNFIGTLGYLAPEFIEKKIISKKLDIFSLGVIIIDILTGGRRYCDISETSNDEFIQDVLKKWQARWQKEGSMDEYSRQIWTCIIIGLEYMDRDRKKRPTIVKIIRKLNKTILPRMSPTPGTITHVRDMHNEPCILFIVVQKKHL